MQVIGDSTAPVVIKKYIPLPVKAAKPSVVPFYQNKHKKSDKETGSLLYKKQFQSPKEKTKTVLVQGTALPGYFDGSYAIRHNSISGDFFYHFIIFFLVFLFAYLTYLRRVFSKYFLQISGSVINVQLSNRLFRDRSAVFEKVDFQMNIFFNIISGVFIVYALKFTGLTQGISEMKLLFMSVSAMAVYSVFRYIISKTTGFFMRKENEFDEYLHNAFIYFKVLGVILLPITVFLIFLPGPLKIYPFYAGLGIVAIMFILRILRCFLLIVGKGVLLLYAILYLCTIEILPLLLLGKYAMSFTK